MSMLAATLATDQWVNLTILFSICSCCVGCYGYTCNYNPIILISISLSCLIDVQKNRINILN